MSRSLLSLLCAGGGAWLALGACSSPKTQSQTPPPSTYPPPGYGAPYQQPGYGPPPYVQPGYPPPSGPPGGYTPGPLPRPPAPSQTPSIPPQVPPAPPAPPLGGGAGGPLAPAPIGSFDVYGALSPQFIRQQPASVIAELIAALTDAPRGKVQGIPLQVIEDPKEVNAFAGCSKTGTAFMGITTPLLVIIARTSETRAFDESFGTAKYNELANGIANEVKAQKAVNGPPAGFLPLPQALDPRKLSRQKFLFDQQVAFILGHELAHHYRGHTGCANGAATSSGVTPQDIGRVLSSTVPLFNQPNEIESDLQGTFNLLDAGNRRQGGSGKWSEEGAMMTLDFFGRLERLGVETIVLGFLMTHPPPQLRLPIVQNAAQQWRGNGGRAPVFPFQLPM